MKLLDLVFCIMLWTGILLITLPKKSDLKDRITAILGKGKDRAKSGKIAGFFKSIAADIRRERMSEELSQSLAYVKNVVVLGRGENISAELLLEELSELSGPLSSAYTDMAHYLHLNDKDRAQRVLADLMPTGFGGDIGLFLAGWEDIPADELLASVDMFQSALREERLTKQKKRDEMVSDLIYFPVVANCMIVLLNFIFIAYFIPQQDALGLLF